MPGSDGSQEADRGAESEPETVQRAFTCTVCGYATTHEVARLASEVQSTCVNCGEWTVQQADAWALIETARDVAERLAGEVLTERQALAHLLRDLVGLERETAADAMDTSASNVDNLQRRGREKVSDARRIVSTLDRMLAEE